MALKTTKWDAAEHINTPEDIAAYLEAAFEDGDPEIIKAILGDIARSKGISKIAEKTGLSRMGLYKALSPDGDPKLSTLLNIMKVLGLQLTLALRKAA